MTPTVEQLVEAMSQRGAALLKERLVTKSVVRNQTLIGKGDAVSGAYFVLDGVLRVYTLGPNGRETPLYRITTGETCVLALNALFNNLLYPAWVETDADTVLGVLPGEAYRTLFATEKSFQDMTVKALSSALFGLMAAVESREAQSVEQRIANYLLLNLSADYKVKSTQQEIADRIGTTREVVGRSMADFANRRMLISKRGTVTILDLKSLKEMTG